MYVDKNTFEEEELEGYEGFTMLSKENNEIYFLIEKLEIFDLFKNHPIEKIKELWYSIPQNSSENSYQLENNDGLNTIQTILDQLYRIHSFTDNEITIDVANIEFSDGLGINYSHGEFHLRFNNFESLVYYTCKVLETCKYNAIETFSKILKYRGKHCSIYPTSEVNCDPSEIYLGNFNAGITPVDFNYDSFLTDEPF
jgi:hypothetical protein